MKKTIVGLGLLVLAGWILLQGSFGIPLIHFNVWPLLGIALFVYFAIDNLLDRDYPAAVFLGLIALIIANSAYRFLAISTGTLVLGGILACIGLGMIFRPKHRWKRFASCKGKGFTSDGDEIAFGNGSRYIHSDDFQHDRVSCSFGTAAVYFDHAKIVGQSASFDVEVSFGTVTLYIPASWRVELQVDNAFGSVSNPRNVNEKEKTLYIKGDVAFAKLEIVYV